MIVPKIWQCACAKSAKCSSRCFSRLAASLLFPEDQPLNLIISERKVLSPLNTMEAIAKGHKILVNRISFHRVETEDWICPLIDYLRDKILSESPKEWESIHRRAARFFYKEETKVLYRRSFDRILLRCLSKQEAEEVMDEDEVHSGLCGAH